MRKWILLAVVLAGVAFTAYKWPDWKPAAGPAESRLSTRPTTAVVETRDIRFAVNAAGDIGPAEQVSVRPEVNGRIATLNVDLGDTARKGDILFSLDDRDLQIEKQSQEKEIERANLQLGQADRNYRRASQLFESRLISQELYEDARTQFELSKNALERAQKSLELVNDRIRKTVIVAPFDCTVLTRPVSVGQAVSGSGGFNSGTEVLTIADLHEMVINAHINQADVTRLKAGQQVEVGVEAVPGLEVIGTVERIAPQATIRNNIKGFATRILLKDVDPRVRPGMTANIKIPVAAVEGVVAVPLSAVFTDLDPETEKTERCVYVKKDDEYEKRPVQIGVSDFFYAEVQQGLSTGEVVALELPKSLLARSGGVKQPFGMRAGGGEAAPAGRRPAVTRDERAPGRTNAPAGPRAPAPSRPDRVERRS
jgi:HlyD family secretion protein